MEKSCFTNAAFRVDASMLIGTGHFMRCLTLAEALKKTGVDNVLFLCRHLPPAFEVVLKQKSINLVRLIRSGNIKSDERLPHYPWLGVSQIEDAEECIEALSSFNVDWLIVDHYAIDSEWEDSLRGIVQKIFVIDDIANKSHSCDVLLDQNLYPSPLSRYQSLVTSGCKLLLGPDFAILRDEFRIFRKKVLPRRGAVNRVLISLGGGEVSGVTETVINAIASSNLRNTLVDVVIGSQQPNIYSVQNVCLRKKYELHVQSNNMAELMALADFSIGAGGTSTWERCSLGLPSVILAIADNQVEIARSIDAVGAGYYLSGEVLNDLEFFKCRIDEISGDKVGLEKAAHIAFNLVDGEGVVRVIEAMQHI